MKLNYKRTMLIGLAFLSISAFWQMYDSEVPLILKNTFQMKETLTGTIMAADNVLALFLLPLLGALSDKVDTKIGKRMPFVLVGTGLAVTLLMVLAYAEDTKNIVMFVIVLLMLLVSMGLYRSPAVALMPDLTPKPLRSKGNAVINLMGAIGGLYALVMVKVMKNSAAEDPSYYPLFISIAAFMAICVLILFLTIKEKKLGAEIVTDNEEDDIPKVSSTAQLPKEVKRSLIFILVSVALWFTAYNGVTTAFSRYATTVWGMKGGGYADCLMVCTVSAIISYIPIGIISARIGRKKSILIGIALLGLCFGVAGIFNAYHPIMNVFFAIIGFAWASIGVNSLPMVVEMCSAADVGKYTGYYYTFSMSAQVITPILSGFLLEHISYRVLFPYAVVFTILAFACMTQVKHGDAKPIQKKSMLENFDVED